MNYEIIPQNRSNLALSVKKDYTISVKCPLDADEKSISSYIKNNSLSVFHKIEIMRKKDIESSDTALTVNFGEKITFLNKERTVKPEDNIRKCIIRDNEISINSQNEPCVNYTVLHNEFILNAKLILSRRLKYMSEILDIKGAKAKVISLYKDFYFVCDSVICFSWHLVFASPTDIDYIITKALCEFDNRHSDLFKNSVIARHFNKEESENRINKLITEIDYKKWI